MGPNGGIEGAIVSRLMTLESSMASCEWLGFGDHNMAYSRLGCGSRLMSARTQSVVFRYLFLGDLGRIHGPVLKLAHSVL